MTIETSELPPGYRFDQRSGALLTVPWPEDPEERVRLARSSLGPAVIDWAEGRSDEPGLVHHLTGHPWRFTAGQKRFVVLWYCVGPNGRWLYRSGVKRGAKGTGKDPFAAALCLIELVGPARFDGWDAEGLPVGAPHRMALVQVASNSEAQSKDVLRVANGMVPRDSQEFYGFDRGETRTTVAGGGRLEVLTASERSSEGDPATFIAMNETHHMTASSGGHTLANVARRNVGKSPADVQARLCEFTNAHQRGSDSVAERSFEAWQLQAQGKTRRTDILYDSVEAPPGLDLADDAERMAGLRAAYSDAPWTDLERIEDEVLDVRTPPGDTIRYYFNGLATHEDAWVEPAKFDSLARPEEVVADGEPIVMFLDCSKSEDATGLVGCRISDGHVFTLGVWQRPRGARGATWLAPREEVDALVDATFERYLVQAFGVDPSPARDDDTEHLYWQEQIDAWHRKHGRKLKKQGLWTVPTGKDAHSCLFDMRTSTIGGKDRNREFVAAAEQTAHDIDSEEASFTWDGNAVMRTHAHQAMQYRTPWGISLGKVSRDSGRLVDLAVCAVGARMLRRRVLNAGVSKKRRTGAAAGF